jgi:hypothetical protein
MRRHGPGSSRETQAPEFRDHREKLWCYSGCAIARKTLGRCTTVSDSLTGTPLRSDDDGDLSMRDAQLSALPLYSQRRFLFSLQGTRCDKQNYSIRAAKPDLEPGHNPTNCSECNFNRRQRPAPHSSTREMLSYVSM